MPDQTHIFIDFDDTLSDFKELGAQYVARLADNMAGEFGGDSAGWRAAIEPALAESIHRYVVQFTGNPLGGYRRWLVAERLRVAERVFAAVGKTPPAHEDLGELARRLQFDALSGCQATLPGAKECLSELHDMDVHVHLASSQESDYLFAALLATSLSQYTETKFGPDLVDCAKEGPEFYERIFQVTGIRPSQAIVVDDQAMCLDFAEEAGARVIQALVRPDPPEPEFPVVIRDLRELPSLVRRMIA